MRESRGPAALLAVVTALFIISFGVSLPILLRPFYYMQIGPLGIQEDTGYAPETIKGAYDEMLDYCTGLRKDFSTGALRWSEEGKAHFGDVRSLFLLDLGILAATAAVLIAYALIRRSGGRPLLTLFGRGSGFWGGTAVFLVSAVLAALCSIDFDRAFTAFHRIFFPGRSNWIFDPETDEIIRILPERFFANCAILIAAVMAALSLLFVLHDIRRRRREGHGRIHR